MLNMQIDDKWRVTTHTDSFLHGDIQLYRHGELTAYLMELDNVHRAAFNELYRARTVVSCMKTLIDAIPPNIPA